MGKWKRRQTQQFSIYKQRTERKKKNEAFKGKERKKTKEMCNQKKKKERWEKEKCVYYIPPTISHVQSKMAYIYIYIYIYFIFIYFQCW